MHDLVLMIVSYVFIPVSCALLVVLLFPFPQAIKNTILKRKLLHS